MSNYILEGETFFVLSKLNSLIEGKKVEFNPDSVSSFSLIKRVDFYVYTDPEKEIAENINDKFIICYLDKNVDQRLDYIKRLKQKAEFISFEPIPSTDPNSLKDVFRDLNIDGNFLPTKKANLKFKGAKQNYEWYDLCLISDLYQLDDGKIFQQMFDAYFDIWKFTDLLWSGNNQCLNQIQYINDKNFEDYFNRIRETTKDYLEVIQSNTRDFNSFRKACPNSSITNAFRYDKIKEKLERLKPGTQINALYYIEECLKNVRMGSNPKLELIKLFFRFKQNVSK